MVSPSKLKSSVVGSKTSLLKSNPKISGSNAQGLNIDPTTTNTNKKGSQLLSNPKLNDSSDTKKGTDSVRATSKQVSIISHSSKQSPQKTSPLNSKSNLGSQNPIKRSTASLGQGSLKGNAIPVTSTVHTNKSPTFSPEPPIFYTSPYPKYDFIPVTSNHSSQSPDGIIKCEAIPVTSTVHINKSIRSSPQSSNKKTELEIDHISVYPVPFGSQKLHNVPILPISDKYDYDDEINNEPEDNIYDTIIEPIKEANIDEYDEVANIDEPVEDNIVDLGQELNDLAHDLPSTLDSGSSDVFLLNETQVIDGNKI